MAADLSQFLQTFFEESFEGLDVMESGLLDLDVGDADQELVNAIFRAAHSIKGGSATFGLEDVAEFTHVMETLLDQWRDGSFQVTQGAVDKLLLSVDCLKDMLLAKQNEEEPDRQRIAAMQTELEGLLGGSGDGDGPVAEAGADDGAASAAGMRVKFRPHGDLFRTGNDPLRLLRELADLGNCTVQVDTDALPPLKDMDPETSYLAWVIEMQGGASRNDVEEVFTWVEDECDLEIEAIVAPAPEPPVVMVEDAVTGELVQERRRTGDRRKNDRRSVAADSSSIRVNIDKIDAVINLVGELVITQSMLSTLGENFDMGKLHLLQDGLAQLERNTRELQEDVMRMRMLPISFAFNRFPRMVRDVSAKLGKQIELRMSGEGTELDKTLIEKLSDPLVHLVRNSLDHGIETAAERRAAGKPETGTVSLNAYHKGGNVVIEVSDDGRGLNTDKILDRAVQRGLVAEDAQLSREQIYELLFMPGFSTAEVVSDISGRGVGMDVVRRNIQALGGVIDIDSEQGRGSRFTVRLPLTLAILDGQSVSVGKETYIVPLVSIIESIQIKPGMVNHVAGRGETFHLRNEYLPIIRLAEVFGSQAHSNELSEGLLVVVEGEGRRVGLFVDDLLGQQQVVIKSLETNYQRIDGVSGATILGNGAVALILDIPGLIRLAGQNRSTVAQAGGSV